MPKFIASFRLPFLPLLATSLAACAAGGPSAPSPEAALTAAGFTRTVATTPQQLSQYRTLPQRRVVAFGQGDVTRYLYADAEGCRCVYEGSEDAYRRYQAVQRR